MSLTAVNGQMPVNRASPPHLDGIPKLRERSGLSDQTVVYLQPQPAEILQHIVSSMVVSRLFIPRDNEANPKGISWGRGKVTLCSNQGAGKGPLHIGSPPPI